MLIDPLSRRGIWFLIGLGIGAAVVLALTL
jgi:hypothetical protein